MIDLKTVSEEERMAILARRKYMSEWRKANPEKVKEHQQRYWSKKFREDCDKLSAEKCAK